MQNYFQKPISHTCCRGQQSLREIRDRGHSKRASCLALIGKKLGSIIKDFSALETLSFCPVVDTGVRLRPLVISLLKSPGLLCLIELIWLGVNEQVPGRESDFSTHNLCARARHLCHFTYCWDKIPEHLQLKEEVEFDSCFSP